MACSRDSFGSAAMALLRQRLWARAALAIAFIFISDLRGLLSYLGFTLSISAALSVASLFLVAKREGPQSVSVRGYPFTPVFYVVVTLVLAGIAGWREPMQFLAAAITIVSGLVVYYAFGLHKVGSAMVLPAGAMTSAQTSRQAVPVEKGAVAALTAEVRALRAELTERGRTRSAGVGRGERRPQCSRNRSKIAGATSTLASKNSTERWGHDKRRFGD